MLFVLDTGLCAGAERGNREAIRIINDLCTSVKYGRHSLYADREVLNRIKNNVLLNPDSRGIVSHILDYYSMKYGDVLGHIKWYIRLSIDGESVTVSIKQGGVHEFTVPISFIADDSFFRESILLLENSEECKFYQQLASLYASEITYYDSFTIEADLGGGDTTSKELKKWIDSKRICICICDSDVSFPGCSYGKTYRKCLDMIDENWPLCYLTSTSPFREVENLIPIHSLRQMGKSDGNIRDYCNDLTALSAFDNSVPFYLDVKKGMNFKGLHSMEHDCKSYYQRILVGSSILTSSRVDEILALSEDEMQTMGSTIIIHGCGSSILASCVESFPSLHKEDLSGAQEAVCLRLGSLVYHFGFNYGRIVM